MAAENSNVIVSLRSEYWGQEPREHLLVTGLWHERRCLDLLSHLMAVITGTEQLILGLVGEPGATLPREAQWRTLKSSIGRAPVWLSRHAVSDLGDFWEKACQSNLGRSRRFFGPCREWFVLPDVGSDIAEPQEPSNPKTSVEDWLSSLPLEGFCSYEGHEHASIVSSRSRERVSRAIHDVVADRRMGVEFEEVLGSLGYSKAAPRDVAAILDCAVQIGLKKASDSGTTATISAYEPGTFGSEELFVFLAKLLIALSRKPRWQIMASGPRPVLDAVVASGRDRSQSGPQLANWKCKETSDTILRISIDASSLLPWLATVMRAKADCKKLTWSLVANDAEANELTPHSMFMIEDAVGAAGGPRGELAAGQTGRGDVVVWVPHSEPETAKTIRQCISSVEMQVILCRRLDGGRFEF